MQKCQEVLVMVDEHSFHIRLSGTVSGLCICSIPRKHVRDALYTISVAYLALCMKVQNNRNQCHNERDFYKGYINVK